MTKWSIGLRSVGLKEKDIDIAFNNGDILRTHLMRPTWHFVSPRDIRWLLALTAPRVHQASAFMYRQCGLDNAIFNRSSDVLAKALQGGKHQTREELQLELGKAGIEAEGFRLGYIMMHSELEGIICSGPRRGNQFTYALLDERVSNEKKLDRTESLAELSTRYFTSRGPATVQDFSYWSGLTIKEATEGLEMTRSHFQQEIIEGKAYFFIPSEAAYGDKIQSTFLMSDYDEYGMGYKDRSALSNHEFSGKLTYNRLLIVEGLAAGSWKRTVKKDKVLLEIIKNVPLTRDQEGKIAAAVKKYGEFTDKSIEIIE